MESGMIPAAKPIIGAGSAPRWTGSAERRHRPGS